MVVFLGAGLVQSHRFNQLIEIESEAPLPLDELGRRKDQRLMLWSSRCAFLASGVVVVSLFFDAVLQCLG